MNIDTEAIRAEIGIPEDDFSRGVLELVDEIERLRFELVIARGL